MGRSAPTVAAEAGAVWPPRRIAGPVVVVVAPVVEGTALVVVALVVEGTALVVVASVVVGWTVEVGAVVVGSTVVVGAVVVGWVVVGPNVGGASVVVVPPAVTGAAAVGGPVVVAVPLRANGTVSGMVVDRLGEVVGARGTAVVDAEVGVGSAGKVGSVLPGARGGGGWRGTRVAEATMAAKTAAVSPKANNSSRHGRRGVARCRGRRIGMVASSRFDSFFRLMGCPANASPTGHRGRSCAQQVERCVHACWCGRRWRMTGAGSDPLSSLEASARPAVIPVVIPPAVTRPNGSRLAEPYLRLDLGGPSLAGRAGWGAHFF
jgi:hypothetical protein